MSEFTRLDVPIDDRTLSVVRHGTGDPHVVLECGGGCTAEQWFPVQAVLSELTTWSYDRAGVGGSTASGDWSLAGCVRDLEHWIRELAVAQPPILVGHSLGCHIIRAYYDRHPGSASAMLLIDPRPPYFERLLQEAGVPLPAPPPDSGSIVREITLADDTLAALPPPIGIATAVVSSERFDVPLGALTEDHADVVADVWRAGQQQIAAKLGHETPDVVPGTGHAIPTEAPDYVAGVIRHLVGRVSS